MAIKVSRIIQIVSQIDIGENEKKGGESKGKETQGW